MMLAAASVSLDATLACTIALIFAYRWLATPVTSPALSLSSSSSSSSSSLVANGEGGRGGGGGDEKPSVVTPTSASATAPTALAPGTTTTPPTPACPSAPTFTTHVCVGVSDDEISIRALRWVLGTVLTSDIYVTVLHVHKHGRPVNVEFERRVVEQCQFLARVDGQVGVEFFAGERREKIGQTILRFAQQQHIHMLVLSCPRHDGLKRRIADHHAKMDSCIDQCQIPVIIYDDTQSGARKKREKEKWVRRKAELKESVQHAKQRLSLSFQQTRAAMSGKVKRMVLQKKSKMAQLHTNYREKKQAAKDKKKSRRMSKSRKDDDDDDDEDDDDDDGGAVSDNDGVLATSVMT